MTGLTLDVHKPTHLKNTKVQHQSQGVRKQHALKQLKTTSRNRPKLWMQVPKATLILTVPQFAVFDFQLH